jgi:hypothetical protein
MRKEEFQPMVVDGKGNVVVEENEKIIFKRTDGHGHLVEFVLPDDLNALQVRNAELEKVFEEISSSLAGIERVRRD